MKKLRKCQLTIALGLLISCGASAQQLSTSGDWGSITLSGWVRGYLGVNLQDAAPNTRHNNKWDPSMERGSTQLNLDGTIHEVGFHITGRLTGEINTPYLQRLNKSGAWLGDNLAHDAYNQTDLREMYLNFPLKLFGIDAGPNSTLRIGKQQVAFGNTDFFQVLDQVNGFDFTWRSFLVPENEDIRKPLVMANLMIDVPKLHGQAQFLLIPGSLNARDDFGNNYDIFGGRWSNQPFHTVDFIHAGDGHPALVPYNYRSRGANTSDNGYAFRWSGLLGDNNYSFVYLHQHNGDPVFNSATNPYKQAPVGLLGDTIYPFIDIVGVTGNTYAKWADAVFSTEIAYTFNKPYNVGTNPALCAGNIAGLCGIKTMGTVQTVLRMDKSLNALQGVLGTHAPPFFSVQLFDTWIPGLRPQDDLVNLAGYTARKRQNSTILTGILALSYDHDIIKPGIAGGVDLTNGGGFLVPNIEFAPGNHWRVRLEADLFFAANSNLLGGNSSETYLFGYFKNNDQLFARFTYQF